MAAAAAVAAQPGEERIRNPTHLVAAAARSAERQSFAHRTYTPFAPPCLQAAATAAPSYPDFFPPEAADIEEPAAQAMMAAMRRVPLQVPGLGEVQTAYVGPAAPTPGRPAFVLLHGFGECKVLTEGAVWLKYWQFSLQLFIGARRARQA